MKSFQLILATIVFLHEMFSPHDPIKDLCMISLPVLCVHLYSTCDILLPSIDNCQPIPLVTITEENEEALADKDFSAILKKIGLVPPANEQVLFKNKIRR